MKKNRIKLTQPVLTSRTDVESVLNEITLTTLNRNRAQIEMDKQITAIRERYEATIATCKESIEQKSELVRVWAQANKCNPAEFGKVKSLDFVHAVIGFRTGTPTLKTLRGWTWDRVLETLKTRFQRCYIRTKEEVDKQALLAVRDTEDLKALGLQVEQKESFFIEPKISEQENTITTQQAA